jgi:hypothetical protein
MLGIISIVIFALAYILHLTGTGHPAALAPDALIALGLAFLAAHIVTGAWPWPPRRQ